MYHKLKCVYINQEMYNNSIKNENLRHVCLDLNHLISRLEGSERISRILKLKFCERCVAWEQTVIVFKNVQFQKNYEHGKNGLKF